MRRDDDTTDVATRWAVRVIVALIFTLTGLDKFLPGPAASWIRIFDAIGLGQWFRYFTGIIEIAGGLLFLVPPATPIAALALVVTMLGAMATHVVILKHPGNAIFPAAYLAGVAAAFFRLRAKGP